MRKAKKRIILLSAIWMALTVLLGTSSLAAQTESQREKLNFNQGWKFVRANIEEAVQVDYPMAELERWENVDLPHSVRLEPYNNSGGLNYQGPAMYRKHFSLPESYMGKKLYIEFEGVMGVTDVWVNGQHLQGKQVAKTGEATQYGGYLPFILDVTDVVHCDGTYNVITVLTDNSDNQTVPPGKPQSQLDFTYFGGIYRNVWLESVAEVHITDAVYEDIIAGGGILVDYPEVSEKSATVAVKTHLRNEGNESKQVILKTELVDEEGNTAAEKAEERQMAAGTDTVYDQTLQVSNPNLWNLDHPYLYTLVSTVAVDGKVVDQEETRVGIRKITMSKDTGLLINGEEAGFLSGVNRHQEYAYIGYGASANLQRRDAVKFKTAGFNIVRTSHTVQSIDFIEACDELGILVMECVPGWQHWSSEPVFAKRIQNDIQQMVRRTRNHPSILCYEVSLNETSGMPADFTNQCDNVAKAEHPSIHTSAENPHNGANSDILYGTPSEVAGWSDTAMSLIREYGDYWQEQNGNFTDNARVTRGTGTFYPGGEGAMLRQAENKLWSGYSFVGTGGISLSQGIQNYITSNKRFIGVTMWIGIDHNRGYSDTMSPCGIWDLRRIPKYSYYAFESQRSIQENPYLEKKGVETGLSMFIASSWAEKAPVVDKTGEKIGSDSGREIQVYANTERVRLSVIDETTGQVLWSKIQTPINEKTSGCLSHPPFIFKDVPYSAGSYLKAEGLTAEKEEVLITKEMHTAGKPAKLKLEADYSGYDLIADGSDTVMVYAYVLDEDGNLCQDADNKLYFNVTGDAAILGDGDKRVGANPVCAEAGIMGVFIQAGKTAGDIKVQVQSEGLEKQEITIASKAMTQKAVAYEEIAQGTPIEYSSAYLTEKEVIICGFDKPSIEKEDVTVEGTRYDKSIKAKNMLPISYDLGGHYSRFTASVAVSDRSASGEGAVFKVYTDGTLRYVSSRMKDGVESIDLDVSGCKILTLCAGDETKINTSSMLWLSPYVYEGETPEDESELRENLSQGATAFATSEDEGTSAAAAVDGDIATLWRSAQAVTEGNPQEWTADLGKTVNVRNARLAVEQDYLKCSYEIYTSVTGESWTLQASGAKTAHANELQDKFTASGIRYVKVRFTKVESTQGTGDGREPKASIKEFEIYRDKGVETVRDYNLKGLEIAGTEFAFWPSVTEYEVPYPGFGKELYVKALPANSQSKITINGVNIPESMYSDLSELPYSKVQMDEKNQIVLEVTSPDGGGKKSYTIYFTEQENQAAVYDTQQCFVPGVNGAHGWSYQTRDEWTGEFIDMEDSTVGYVQGEYAWQGDSEWIYSGPRYMHPQNSVNAVRTFTVPQDGVLQYSAYMEKFPNQGGDVFFALWKDGEKIWPEEGTAVKVASGEPKELLLQLKVKAGENLQLVMDAGDNNGGDATGVITSAAYLDTEHIQSASIEGPSLILYREGSDRTAGYTFKAVNTAGQKIEGLPCEWKLKQETEGVTISSDGMLAIDKSVTGGRVILQAIYKGKVMAQKTVQILKGATTYLSDLEWSEAITGDGNTVYKDKSHNQNPLRLTGADGNAVEYAKGIGTHAPSRIVYDIEGKGYSVFNAMVGVDHEENYDNSYASINFKVYLDKEEGTPAYESGIMIYNTPQKEINLEIPETAQKIILVVEQGENNWSDHADWADAKFVTVENMEDTTDQDAADVVKERISEIGSVSYTEESRTKIQAARTAYEALTEAQKALVDNVGILAAAEQTYKDLEEEKNKDQASADAVKKLISEIGSVSYTEESRTKIQAARTAYEALTEAQKALVDNVGILAAAEQTYKDLEEEKNKDQAAADAVKKLISEIGTVSYTEESKSKIESARTAYEALTEAQKALVDNVGILAAAEQTYKDLEEGKQQDQAVADAVKKRISEIGTVSYTEESKSKIESARTAYEALTEAQKALVDNVGILAAAEQTYKDLEEGKQQDQASADAVKKLISEIGTVSYTKESKGKIQAAQAAYAALTEAQKALVDNYDMVTKASAKYKKMETTVRKTKVKKVTIRSAKSTKKKQIKIIWKKASGVSGYEVQYSADRRFKKAKTRTVSKSKTSLQIKGLKRRKIYNVRVRAYKTVYGKKVYGKYSKALKTKIR